jgi:hypothetical protein
MICWTRIGPGTDGTSSHAPVGYGRSAGGAAARPDAGLAVVRAAGQHGKAAIASGAGAPSTPLHMAARYHPGGGMPDPPESAT